MNMDFSSIHLLGPLETSIRLSSFFLLDALKYVSPTPQKCNWDAKIPAYTRVYFTGPIAEGQTPVLSMERLCALRFLLGGADRVWGCVMEVVFLWQGGLSPPGDAGGTC